MNFFTKSILSLSIFIISIMVFSTFFLYKTYNTHLYIPYEHKKHSGYDILVDDINLMTIFPQRRSAVIYIPGGYENPTNMLDFFKEVDPTKAYYIMDYRGSGLTKGKPSQKQIEKDTLKIVDYVLSKHRNVSIIGKGIGSYFAMYAADKNRKLDNIMLIAPVKNITDIAQDKIPYLPMSYIVDPYNLDLLLKKDLKHKRVLILQPEKHLVKPLFYINMNYSKKITERIIEGTKYSQIFNHYESLRALSYFLEANLFSIDKNFLDKYHVILPK